MWTNPLDKVPQVPQDWANHIIWGGGLGIVVAGLLHSFGSTLALYWALGFTLVVAAAKKLVDFFKEHESWQMCVGKTVVTTIWPLTLWVASLLGAA